jgi:hypothetical protein
MDWISVLLSALLFVAFVPGVLVTLPSKGASRNTVLLVHTLVFTVVTGFVMRFYWLNIKGYVESFGNFGPTCPNGYAMQPDQTCVPTGHATYPASAFLKSKTE